MTTGQYPKRRETDRQAEQRIERLRQRAAERPQPIEVPLNGRGAERRQAAKEQRAA